MDIKLLVQSTLFTGAIAACAGGIFSIIKCSDRRQEEAIEQRRVIYEKSQEPIECEVINVKYENRLVGVPERRESGWVSEAYSNETVRLDSKCTLTCKPEDRDSPLGISLLDGLNTDKESLLALINEEGGTWISFPRGNLELYKYDPKSMYARSIVGETYFKPETQFGNKRADRITVLGERN